MEVLVDMSGCCWHFHATELCFSRVAGNIFDKEFWFSQLYISVMYEFVLFIFHYTFWFLVYSVDNLGLHCFDMLGMLCAAYVDFNLFYRLFAASACICKESIAPLGPRALFSFVFSYNCSHICLWYIGVSCDTFQRALKKLILRFRTCITLYVHCCTWEGEINVYVVLTWTCGLYCLKIRVISTLFPYLCFPPLWLPPHNQSLAWFAFWT